MPHVQRQQKMIGAALGVLHERIKTQYGMTVRFFLAFVA